jgi:uncharacterized membrane protein
MPTWLIYGFAASLFWGTDAIMSKIVTSEKYLNVSTMHSSLLMLSGIAAAFLIFFLFRVNDLSALMKFVGIAIVVMIISYALVALQQGNVSVTSPLLFFGIMQGFFWGCGMICTFLAFSGGVDASRLVPIYNTNTLVSLFLGVVFLHELPAPDERLKVISGALLIVIGSILVSK